MRHRPLSDWVLYGLIFFAVLFLILAAIKALASAPLLIVVAVHPWEEPDETRRDSRSPYVWHGCDLPNRSLK